MLLIYTFESKQSNHNSNKGIYFPFLIQNGLIGLDSEKNSVASCNLIRTFVIYHMILSLFRGVDTFFFSHRMSSTNQLTHKTNNSVEAEEKK